MTISIITLSLDNDTLTLSKDIFKYINNNDKYRILFEYSGDIQTNPEDRNRYCIIPKSTFDKISNLFPIFDLAINQNNIQDIIKQYNYVSNIKIMQIILPEEELLYYKLKNSELFDSMVKSVEEYSGDIFLHLKTDKD